MDCDVSLVISKPSPVPRPAGTPAAAAAGLERERGRAQREESLPIVGKCLFLKRRNGEGSSMHYSAENGTHNGENRSGEDSQGLSIVKLQLPEMLDMGFGRGWELLVNDHKANGARNHFMIAVSCTCVVVKVLCRQTASKNDHDCGILDYPNASFSPQTIEKKSIVIERNLQQIMTVPQLHCTA